jgi:hypothetical protein
MMEMFADINIFHGNNLYYGSDIKSVMMLAWWMYNSDNTPYRDNVRPVELISQLNLTAENYKDHIEEIQLKTEAGIWN